MLLMQRPGLAQVEDIERRMEDELKMVECDRPPIVQSRSDPTPSWPQVRDGDIKVDEVSSGEYRDTIHESTFSKFSVTTNLRAPTPRQSASTYRGSPNSSRPNSPFSGLRPSLPSSATSANITVDILPDPKMADAPRRPSILTRLRWSISTSGVSPHNTQRSPVQPCDFLLPPEQPEKHFIDSIGMVIPGVCNRSRCVHPLAHFVTNWRLCEPIEYTTALADHGITYSDYGRLIAALANFLDEIPNEPRRSLGLVRPWWHPRGWQAPQEDDASTRGNVHQDVVPKHNSISESAQQYRIALQQAAALTKLLEEISWNWQRRGLPVMVCVSSYSLFTPNRISESFIQILHVSLQAPTPLEPSKKSRTLGRLSFIDPFVVAKSEERSVAVSRNRLNRRSVLPPPPSTGNFIYHHQQPHLRDRARPWPLWPNAIPSRKRELMHGCADRYGVDPYFRGWMRANVNSGTRCTSYAKYMIERDDNPFVNTRLAYFTPPRRRALFGNLLTVGSTSWSRQNPSAMNRANYEHNRRLECRRTVEHGSRLRIVSFGFRHPIYPPHTPEMEELGLKSEAYQTIIDRIEDIRQNYKSSVKSCLLQCPTTWNKLRHRSTEDALAKVSEYIRQVNAVDRRIVWTIEKIPGVYDRGFGRDKMEWEISAWNGEDPLELLIQLEKWGIIEKRLDIDEDE